MFIVGNKFCKLSIYKPSGQKYNATRNVIILVFGKHIILKINLDF